MDNNNLLSKFQHCIDFSKRNRMEKMIHSPFRTISSKLNSLLALKFKIFRIQQVKLFWGEKMGVVLPEEVSWYLYNDGYFEEGLTYILLKTIQPGNVVVDIGAHFGYFSLLASKLVGENGSVYSFEPTPSTYSLLSENINRKNNITAVNLALHSCEQQVVFNDYGLLHAAFNSMYSPKLPRGAFKENKINVKTISFDQYALRNKITPNFIKMDAEGAELEILKGMRHVLESIRPIITLEVGDYDGCQKSKEVVKRLIDIKYVPFQYEDGKLTEHKIQENYKYDNLVFFPKKVMSV